MPRKRLAVQRDFEGNTPLHIATIHDNLDFAKAVILYYNYCRVCEGVEPEATDELRSGDAVVNVRLERYRMEFCPRLRFLLDIRNCGELTASEAGFAAGAKTTASWLMGFRRQGAQGIEDVEGEESDVEWNRG